MLIEFENVGVETPSGCVLDGIGIALSERRIGIAGPNGAGKSTFARLLNGLRMPTRGQVRVDGLDTRRQTAQVRQRVGFMFQNPENQIVFPVVSEDLAFSLRAAGLDAAARQARIEAQLADLGIAHLLERPAHALSGGERQLVALAAVLLMQPALLVFDELTTQLDLRHRNRFESLLARLPQQAVVVSHDLDLLAGCDRVLVIEAGRVAADDTPAAALSWYRRHCG
ncbi:energy-coupling factor ABC transporter ATP-binding protein [Kerstersia gyiorum]|uniref:energy-coupling factor ABC transporter ATP-binding protein n=1 Tax=Kerstersia gyiorum TaxID=206506 RepID=UPI0020A1BACA|nr:ABC transporter ATP-binding protein [Kerstersia gyiorum]MCP1635035.1 biotin transport system ATP-binding protein [Kerstersia gyiorum]MCP1670038.1 biotin transport system ATP-binding protein [Kerstersia gyiorum]MCP1707943.1 biotin transport system ATP-binding protein [Kerstersia gyiorum]